MAGGKLRLKVKKSLNLKKFLAILILIYIIKVRGRLCRILLPKGKQKLLDQVHFALRAQHYSLRREESYV